MTASVSGPVAGQNKAVIKEGEFITAVQEMLQLALHHYDPLINTQNFQKISSRVFDFLFEKSVFCIEVGGTRVKAAQIPVKLTLEKLKYIQTASFSSTPWFNKSLLLLFKKTSENPLSPVLSIPHQRVSLSI